MQKQHGESHQTNQREGQELEQKLIATHYYAGSLPDGNPGSVFSGNQHIVFDTRHDSTFRVNQSINATKYRKPRRIGIYVMSAHQTWVGRSITSSRSKYGYTW